MKMDSWEIKAQMGRETEKMVKLTNTLMMQEI
jgi:hypothetical protein